MDTYLLPSHSARVNLSFGQSDHPMKQDMQTLIGGVSPRAVRTFNSPPAAVQSRAFYPWVEDKIQTLINIEMIKSKQSIVSEKIGFASEKKIY